jgi:hypothetical protein
LLYGVGASVPAVGAEPKVILYRHSSEQLAPLWHEAEAHLNTALGVECTDVPAVEQDAASARQQADCGRQQAGFARAIGANDGYDLPTLNGERGVAYGLDLAVADCDLLDGEQAVQAMPPR